nr:hypothetical protein [uncultured Brevundimonas sp.]
MRTYLLAGLIAIASSVVVLPAPPAKAAGLNCWYEFVYSSSGVLIEVIPHCEVDQDEIT